MYCYVAGCPNGNSDPRDGKNRPLLQIFFSAPGDEEMFRQWQEAVPLSGKPFSRNDKLCEFHFKKSEVVLFNETKLPNGNVRRIPTSEPKLKRGTIPSIFPPQKSNAKKVETKKPSQKTQHLENQKPKAKRKLSDLDKPSETSLGETPAKPRGRPRKVLADVEQKPSTPEKRRKTSKDELVESVKLAADTSDSETGKQSGLEYSENEDDVSHSTPPAIRLVPLESLLASPKDGSSPSPSKSKKRSAPQETEERSSTKKIKETKGKPASKPVPANAQNKSGQNTKTKSVSPASGGKKKVRSDMDQVCAELELAAMEIHSDEQNVDLTNQETDDEVPDDSEIFEILSIKSEPDVIEEKKTLEELAAELGDPCGIGIHEEEGDGEDKDSESVEHIGEPRIAQVISLSELEDHDSLESALLRGERDDDIESQMERMLGEEPSPLPKSSHSSQSLSTISDVQSQLTGSSIESMKSMLEDEGKGVNPKETETSLSGSEKTVEAQVSEKKSEIGSTQDNLGENSAPSKGDNVADDSKDDSAEGTPFIGDDVSSSKDIRSTVAEQPSTPKSRSEVLESSTDIDSSTVERIQSSKDTQKPNGDSSTESTSVVKETTASVENQEESVVKKITKCSSETDKENPISEETSTQGDQKTILSENPSKDNNTPSEDKLFALEDTLSKDKGAAEKDSDDFNKSSEALPEENSPNVEQLQPPVDTAKVPCVVGETICEGQEASTKDNTKNIPAKENVPDESLAGSDGPSQEEVSPDVQGAVSGDISPENPNEIDEQTCPDDICELDKTPNVTDGNKEQTSESKLNDSDDIFHEDISSPEEVVNVSSDSEDPTWAPTADEIAVSSDSDTNPGSIHEMGEVEDGNIAKDGNDTGKIKGTTKNNETKTKKSTSKKKGIVIMPVAKNPISELPGVLSSETIQQILKTINLPLTTPVQLRLPQNSDGTIQVSPNAATAPSKKGQKKQIFRKIAPRQAGDPPPQTTPTEPAITKVTKYKSFKTQISNENRKKCENLLSLKMFDGLARIKKSFEFSTFLSGVKDDIQFKKFCLLIKECLREVNESKNAKTNIGKLVVNISRKSIKNPSPEDPAVCLPNNEQMDLENPNEEPMIDLEQEIPQTKSPTLENIKKETPAEETTSNDAQISNKLTKLKYQLPEITIVKSNTSANSKESSDSMKVLPASQEPKYHPEQVTLSEPPLLPAVKEKSSGIVPPPKNVKSHQSVSNLKDSSPLVGTKDSVSDNKSPENFDDDELLECLQVDSNVEISSSVEVS